MKDEKEIIAKLIKMKIALFSIKSDYDKLTEVQQYIMDCPIQIMERRIELLIEELENA